MESDTSKTEAKKEQRIFHYLARSATEHVCLEDAVRLLTDTYMLNIPSNDIFVMRYVEQFSHARNDDIRVLLEYPKHCGAINILNAINHKSPSIPSQKLLSFAPENILLQINTTRYNISFTDYMKETTEQIFGAFLSRTRKGGWRTEKDQGKDAIYENLLREVIDYYNKHSFIDKCLQNKELYKYMHTLNLFYATSYDDSLFLEANFWTLMKEYELFCGKIHPDRDNQTYIVSLTAEHNVKISPRTYNIQEIRCSLKKTKGEISKITTSNAEIIIDNVKYVVDFRMPEKLPRPYLDMPL